METTPGHPRSRLGMMLCDSWGLGKTLAVLAASGGVRVSLSICWGCSRQ